MSVCIRESNGIHNNTPYEGKEMKKPIKRRITDFGIPLLIGYEVFMVIIGVWLLQEKIFDVKWIGRFIIVSGIMHLYLLQKLDSVQNGEKVKYVQINIKKALKNTIAKVKK